MSSPPTPQEVFLKFLENQKDSIPTYQNYGKMSFEDIQRIERNIQKDIFDDQCCLYKGEIKNGFASISYRGKKVSVQRLLYHNYIGTIRRNQIIQYVCNNKGICCCLAHLEVDD
jgi:hypothetical protein